MRGQGGEVIRIYPDEGISGYSGALRPEFERLLSDLDERTIDTVVCWRLDRLCRNHRDFQRLWDVCERRGARLVSLHEMFDSSTPVGEFTIRMLIGMAKMESDNISVRVKRALEAVRQSGRLHTGGARPFGYTRTGEPDWRAGDAGQAAELVGNAGRNPGEAAGGTGAGPGSRCHPAGEPAE